MNLTSRWRWVFRQMARKLWLTVVLYALAGLASVVLGVVLAPLIPADAERFVTPDAVGRVLGILASSMLAVTTFSLATMVAAHGAVTGNTSPRATTLVLDNDTTRHALGVFIGSFLFSLVGIVALNAGVYGDRGHVVLFALTVAAILLIVVALLRWIEHLSQLVRVSETSDRVEAAALDALLERARYPGLGAKPCADLAARIPPGARAVRPEHVGYVRHIDMKALVELGHNREVDIFVVAAPGAFVSFDSSLVCLHGPEEEEIDDEALRQVFAIGATRTFDYDPRFGLIVLAEIASRALSPGINDPGTAIDVIGRATRLLSRWATTAEEDDAGEERDGASIWFPAVTAAELVDDMFTPVARDGAGIVSVQVRLQKALAALAALDHPPLRDAAVLHSRRAWERAREAMAMDFDREVVAALVLARDGDANQEYRR